MELLKNLYSIHSPSRGESALTRFVVDWVKKNAPSAVVSVDSVGNVLITKGNAVNYPCFVAHLDQVQKKYANDYEVIENNGVLFGFSRSLNAFQGLGADDKNGVYVCLRLLQELDNIKVALFVGEEVGGVGSSAVDVSFFDDVLFVAEIDRRGSSDLIINASGVELCSDEFANIIVNAGFGFAPANGLFTDVVNLKEMGVNVCCCNLSAGYYNAHTVEEITVFSELINTLNLCRYLAKTISEPMAHIYTPYHYGYSADNDYYSYCDSMDYYTLCELLEFGVTSFKSLWRNYKHLFTCSKKEAQKMYDEAILYYE